MSTTGGAAVGRYHAAAMTLHWLIALAIVIQLLLGWWMNEWVPDHSPQQDQIQSVHISLGLTILLLVLLRIVVRFTFRTPPEPAGMQDWERWLARLSHFVWYLLMLALPLTGWTVASLSPDPLSFWGLPWPHLPGVAQLFGTPAPKETFEQVKHVHVFILIWIALITLALHVAGALWHQFRRPRVLWRMVPFLAPPSPLPPTR